MSHIAYVWHYAFIFKSHALTSEILISKGPISLGGNIIGSTVTVHSYSYSYSTVLKDILHIYWYKIFTKQMLPLSKTTLYTCIVQESL